MKLQLSERMRRFCSASLFTTTFCTPKDFLGSFHFFTDLFSSADVALVFENW